MKTAAPVTTMGIPMTAPMTVRVRNSPKTIMPMPPSMPRRPTPPTDGRRTVGTLYLGEEHRAGHVVHLTLTHQ
ncbi:hypothetical protein [Streptomyces antibioticus]|uniref:hypothetical protein n=1 Tax=Streptomyces antibioticus TaxID=1890 RepID=UPI00195F3341|nr:hypothetical protein [Streptomyces antibioticus]MBO7935634.1 hypothetical protein [Streptomyces sp. S9]MCX4740821.1 hypothetical protein [Streptomyces antibioticus]